MSWRVKGTLFRDYVRTIRAHKEVHWLAHFRLEDLPYLSEHIDGNAWYPMETFERMGLAILKLVADCDLQTVRMFGRSQVDWLLPKHLELLVAGDPVATISHFQQHRQSFFDFPALEVVDIAAYRALVSISFRMSPDAEQAACVQTLGFLERLMELATQQPPKAQFLSEAWKGSSRTVLEVCWKQPANPSSRLS
jgi:hypothetical protein